MMTSPSVANPTIASTPTPIASNARLEHNKKVLTYLGIVEFVIGSFAIVFSCVIVGYSSGWLNYHVNYPYDSYNTLHNTYTQYVDSNSNKRTYIYAHRRPFTIGEGIWCGVWILIGGALGIASGRKRSTLCLINCHMGFSIVGAIFSGVLLSTGIVTALINTTSFHWLTGLESLLAFGGFVTFILCIVSAAYCCKTASSAGLNTCCGTCCAGEVTHVGVGQTMYVGIPQSHQQVQQTVVQTYSPNRTDQHEPYYGNIVNAMQPNVVAEHQPMFVVQQQHPVVAPQSVLAAQQHCSSSSDPSKRSQANAKQNESWKFSANTGTSAEHSDTPPSYFQSV